MMDKNELRREIRAQKHACSAAQLDEWSKAIVELLMAMPEVKAARTVMLYHPLPDEVDTREALYQLHAQGKRVLLPVVTGDDTMEMAEYHPQSDQLAEGSFHIMEPVGTWLPTGTSVEVIVVPGMAFDKEHNRLGRGKGYYDRFLSQHPEAYKIGICFPFQTRPQIPNHPHDVKMDTVVTLL